MVKVNPVIHFSNNTLPNNTLPSNNKATFHRLSGVDLVSEELMRLLKLHVVLLLNSGIHLFCHDQNKQGDLDDLE